MLQHSHLVSVDEQTIAQAELTAYIEAQAQEIAPEPEVQFIDLDNFYNVRWYCPDIFTGTVVYTPDELDEATDEEGNLVKSVPEPVSVQATAVESPEHRASQPNSNGNGHPHNERVRGVRTLLGIEGRAVLEWLKMCDSLVAQFISYPICQSNPR